MFSSVLAARAVGIQVVASQVLWDVGGLTNTPVTVFTAAPTDPGTRATCSEIILRQGILKDGSHREHLIKVKFGEDTEHLNRPADLIKQYILTGHFMNPYELASFQERNITEQ
uniref:Uncharacterized protein n=1 Tax=Neovison vison TaxID=452646 RepID=A0A8C7AXF2_NEOVI